MPHPADVSMRVLRAAAVAVAIIALALTAHRVGHGAVPPVLAIAPVVITCTAVAAALSRRRITSTSLLALIGCAQVVIHLLAAYLEGGSHHVATPPPTSMVVAHVACTVITTAALAHAERIWWQLISWLGRWRAALRLPNPVATPDRHASGHLDTPAADRQPWSAPTRGPPVPLHI